MMIDYLEAPSLHGSCHSSHKAFCLTLLCHDSQNYLQLFLSKNEILLFLHFDIWSYSCFFLCGLQRPNPI